MDCLFRLKHKNTGAIVPVFGYAPQDCEFLIWRDGSFRYVDISEFVPCVKNAKMEKGLPEALVCKITSNAVSFVENVRVEDLREKAIDIWENPENYRQELSGNSEAAYFDFLQYLQIIYPDGHTVNLVDVVKEFIDISEYLQT